MKLIGHKEDGDVLLECSSREYKVLFQLMRVAQGRPTSYGIEPRDPLDAETEATLSAICEWIEIKDRANALRRLAAMIDNEIKVKA